MNLLILGANSDVANAIATIFAQKERAALFLASRDTALLDTRAKDLSIRYQIPVQTRHFDATNFTSHAEFYKTLDPKPDGVVVSFGHLGNQQTAQDRFEEAHKIIDTNFTGALSILEIIAHDFEKRGHGFIIGISSVAGLRGRQSNYIYGAAKGALSIYLSGLRNRLQKRNCHVMTILPGFIDTKMTQGMELPARLTAQPSQVAQDVYKAFCKNSDVVYTRWYWRWIMRIICAIPEKLFKRMNL